MDLQALQSVALVAMSLIFFPFLAIMVGLLATESCILALAAMPGLTIRRISATPVHSVEAPP
jgi:hypothetical protein